MQTRTAVLLVSALLFTFVAPILAADEPAIPPPLRLQIPFEAAWNGMQEAIQTEKLLMVSEDRGQGHMVTSYREYSSGPLAESHIAKIGVRPKITDGDWLKVEYQYEVHVDLVGPKETLVTVDTNIRALKRTFLGEELWIEIPTNGRCEESLLTKFGELLFGETFELRKSKSSFWDGSHTNLTDIFEGRIRTAAPEHP